MMTHSLTCSLPLLALCFMAMPTFGFVFPSRTAQKPELLHYTESQIGTLLNIRLDVGKDNESRMNVNGMMIELLPDAIDKKNGKFKMPGANGMQPQLSSGVRKLNVVQQGNFVGMNGANHLDMVDGCWEMVWRDGAAAGVLVCGFDLTQEYRRNDAVLPKGRFYMSFPIWTRQGLDEKQEHKRIYERMAKEHKTEYNQELEKMAATNNLLMKAWHFRNACAADEKHSLIPHREVAQIPLDHEIIPLEDKLFLSNKGLVWTQEGSLQFGHSSLLGSALATDGAVTAEGGNKMDYKNMRP